MKTLATLLISCVLVAPALSDDQPAGWDLSLAIGGNLTDGNSETLGANASLTAARDYAQYALRLGVEGNYGETTTTADDGADVTDTTTQNAKASANIKRTFGTPFIYVDGSLFHDDPAGIDMRTIAGLGAGLFAPKTDTTQVSLEVGAAYITEDLQAGAGEDGVTLRAAAVIEHTLSKTAKTWGKVEYLPMTEDFGNYLVNAEAGVEAAINSTLSLRVVVQDRYDSTPADDLKENDLAVIAGIVYTL